MKRKDRILLRTGFSFKKITNSGVVRRGKKWRKKRRESQKRKEPNLWDLILLQIYSLGDGDVGKLKRWTMKVNQIIKRDQDQNRN